MGFTPSQIVYDGATPGSGKEPTASYTASDGTLQFACGEFNSITLDFVLIAGTAPTSIEFLLEVSPDKYRVPAGSSTWRIINAQVVGAGTVTAQETVRSITWATVGSSNVGHVWSEAIHAQKFRLRVKRTGGNTDTRILVTAMMGLGK